MNRLALIVDGMLSGTGIRDAINGGYLEPREIGASAMLQSRINTWLSRYEDAHYYQFKDKEKNRSLDKEGVEIAKMVKVELPATNVRYFSAANMQEIKL
jgi:hypothetical protein